MDRGPIPTGDQLTAINAALANAPADEDSILSAATSALRRIRDVTWVALVMNPNPETSRAVVATQSDPRIAEYINSYFAEVDLLASAPTAGLSRQVIESGVPMVRPRISLEELLTFVSPAFHDYYRRNPPPGGERGVGFVVVPMRVGEAIIGTLGAHDWTHEQPLDDEDVGWVQAVADRIALSLEHARLARMVADDAMRIDLIRSVGLAVGESDDPRLVSSVVVEQITGRLGVDAAAVLLVAGGADELVLTATSGFVSPVRPGLRIPISRMNLQSGWAPVLEHVSDTERKTRDPRGAQFAREAFRTIVTVKLGARDRLLGLLELYNRSVVEWDQRWLDFFDTLGDLLGVAIDRAVAPPAESAPAAQSPAVLPDLSELELEILRLIADGLTNREIAQRVHRSENTVKFHVRRILERTEAPNRTELARRATRAGWL